MVKKIMKKEGFKKGFSLIEFFVIVTIFSIMAGITALNYREFQAEIELRNLAYDVALSIRQTQTFGISATDSTMPLSPATAIPSDDRSIYGIYFEGSDRLVIFQDLDKSKTFDSENDRVLSDSRIATGDIIKTICKGDSKPGTCVSSESKNLVAIFQRPFPDAVIKDNSTSTEYAYTSILLESGKKPEVQKMIELWNTGAINIANN